MGIERAGLPAFGRAARAWLGALALIAALVAAPPRAGAHAILVEATPADAAQLAAAPAQLVLRFNSRIEHKLSSATLVSGDARRPLTPDADAPPDRLVAPLPALGPGSYTVEWQVLSVDGHRVAGKLAFSISGPS